MSIEIFCNSILSPPDSRDWRAETIYPHRRLLRLPDVLDLSINLLPPTSQGKQGSCAAQAGACIKEWQKSKETLTYEYMSTQFIYNNRMNYPDSGMHGRNVMKILQKKGCCRENIYPYGNTLNKFPEEVVREASEYKIANYARIRNDDVDMVKIALYKNGPCYVSFVMYNRGPRFWKSKDVYPKRLGFHAVTIVGYNKKGFKLRNSWGPGWNKNGYTIIPYKDFKYAIDIWTVIDEKSSMPDIVVHFK